MSEMLSAMFDYTAANNLVINCVTPVAETFGTCLQIACTFCRGAGNLSRLHRVSPPDFMQCSWRANLTACARWVAPQENVDPNIGVAETEPVDAEAFQQGIVESVVETIKGLGHSLHSIGQYTLTVLFEAISPQAGVSYGALPVVFRPPPHIYYVCCNTVFMPVLLQIYISSIYTWAYLKR
jgi:hypothetical protein